MFNPFATRNLVGRKGREEDAERKNLMQTRRFPANLFYGTPPL